MNPLSMQFPFAVPPRLNVAYCGLAAAAALLAGCSKKEETMLAAGTVADDKFVGAVNFYVKGVESQVLGEKGGK